MAQKPRKGSGRTIGTVHQAIRQRKGFASPGQEATIALLRTASVVGRVISRVLEPRELSLAQYNALRIIRGAGSAGLPTLAIRERMIEEGTTITRLLDRLEAAGLIERERSLPDRRQVICTATPAGKKLLDRIDPVVDAADAEAMAALTATEARQLIALLDRVREANADRAAPRTMARAD